MTKKIVCVVLTMLLMMTFTGCKGMDSTKETQEETSMFVIVEQRMVHGSRYSVVYHKQTNVMYTVSYTNQFTVMVDAEGKPLLYANQ